MRIFDRIGDADPIEYGGGVVTKDPDGGYSIEYTHGLDWEGSDPKKMPVFRVPVEGDVFEWNDWADVEDIADFTSIDPDELLALGRGRRIMGRVAVTQDIASYYGWDNLDSYPVSFSAKELEKRWKL